MFMYLQNSMAYDGVARVDTEFHRIEYLSKKADETLRQQRISGWFAEVNATFVAFYRNVRTSHWHIWIGEHDFQILDDMTIELKMLDAQTNLFLVRQGKRDLLRHSYRRPELDKIDLLRIDMGDVEEENFDVFLFINNVWNNPERRKRAARGLLRYG